MFREEPRHHDALKGVVTHSVDASQGGIPGVASPNRRVIGVISDTHALLRAEALAYLRGCDIVVHAGDVGSPEVIEELATIAPIYAVRGNNDKGPWADSLPEVEMIEFGGKLIYMVHDAADIDIDPQAAGVDLVVTGHTHRPKLETRDGVVYLNPGSAGPRRFRLPIALAKVSLEGGAMRPEIQELESS